MSDAANIILIITAENQASQVLQDVTAAAKTAGAEVKRSNESVASSAQQASSAFGSYKEAALQAAKEQAQFGQVSKQTETAMVGLKKELMDQQRVQRTVNLEIRESREVYAQFGAVFSDVSGIIQKGINMWNTLNIAQIKQEEISERLVMSQERVVTTQQNLNNAVALYGSNSQQAIAAQEKYEKATRDVEKAQSDLARHQQETTLAMIGMAAQLPSLIGNFTKLATDVNKLQFLMGERGGLSGILKGLPGLFSSTVPAAVAHAGSLNAIAVSTGTATTATHGFRLASIAAFLTNPVTAAIIGVTTLILLLATNTFGLRDAFWDIAKAVYELINTYFKPLAVVIDVVVGAVRPLADMINNALDPSLQQASTSTNQLTGAATVAAPALGSIGSAAESAVPSLQNFEFQIDNIATSFPPLEAGAIRVVNAFGEIIQTSNAAEISFGTRFVPAAQDAGSAMGAMAGAASGAAQDVGSAMGAMAGAASGAAQSVASSIESMMARANAATQASIQQAIAAGAQLRQITAGGTAILSVPRGGGSKRSDAELASLGFNQDDIRALRASDAGAVQARQQVLASTTDQSGRLIYQGQPLSTGPASFGEDLYYKGVFVGVGSGLGGIPKTARARENLDQALRNRGIPAQGGFDGMVYRPTLFMTAEAGPEHVKVTPRGTENMKVLKIILVDASGFELGSAIVRDDEKEFQIKMKVRNSRLV